MTQALSISPYKAVRVIVNFRLRLYDSNRGQCGPGGAMPGESSIDKGSAGPTAISTRQEFAAGLTALRERAGLTVRDVAQQTGIPSSTVGGYFGGRHVPPLKPADQLRKILAACGVDQAAAVEG